MSLGWEAAKYRINLCANCLCKKEYRQSLITIAFGRKQLKEIETERRQKMHVPQGESFSLQNVSTVQLLYIYNLAFCKRWGSAHSILNPPPNRAANMQLCLNCPHITLFNCAHTVHCNNKKDLSKPLPCLHKRQAEVAILLGGSQRAKFADYSLEGLWHPLSLHWDT